MKEHDLSFCARFCGGSLLVWLLFSTAGCGPSAGTISGKVTYRGQILNGGKVLFAHEKGIFTAAIQEDGSYRLDKIPSGTVKIAVFTLQSPRIPSNLQKTMKKPTSISKEAGESLARQFQQPGGKYVSIPKSYEDAEKSGLTYTVTTGKQTHDVNLQ